MEKILHWCSRLCIGLRVYLHSYICRGFLVDLLTCIKLDTLFTLEPMFKNILYSHTQHTHSKIYILAQYGYGQNEMSWLFFGYLDVCS